VRSILIHIGEKKYKIELDSKSTHETLVQIIKTKLGVDYSFELQFHDSDFDEWVHFGDISEIPSSLRIIKIRVLEKESGKIQICLTNGQY
jgi:hypothetical protein